MKKRLFSLLLSLCLVAGLFAGMTTTAYADGDTQTYTVQLGDTLGSICAKLGVDYNANKEWILKTNKIANQNIISVGHVLTLPAKGKVLKWTDTTATTGTTTGTTTGSTITGGAAATGFSVPTQTYTLKSGDFVSVICQKLGVDFAKNDAWIRAANNITNYNNLKVGRVIVLPAAGTTPDLSTASSGSVATTTGSTVNAVNTVATNTSTKAVGLLAGDTISYYLVKYTVRSGDTLYKICQNYGANMDTVQKMNGIADASKLRVGQVLSIPSASASAGSVAVVAHKVVSGDTVQGICNKYGVNYGTNATLIKGLNNRDNLDAIKVGQTILIPVAGAVNGGGSSGGSSVTPGSSSAAAYYTLNKSGAVNGTYSLTVNGQSVNGAAAGQSVHVVATPDHGYKLASISVVRDYNGVAVDVDKNNNFVMPACDVRITVSFVSDPNAAPHAIQASSVSHTSNMTFVVNGYTNTTAEPGKSVTIVLGTLMSGQTVDKVYVTTVQPTEEQLKKGSLDAKSYVSVSNMSFVMPTTDVYVTVFLKGA